MNLRLALRSVGALLVAGVLAAGCSDARAAAPEMVVYATPSCGCCGAWMDHMRENGFAVEVVYQNDLSEVRDRHGIPRELRSCHFGVVDGYTVEGHVPASVVQRLLQERPAVKGIAVPGMPAGSPGMEMPGGTTEPYDVFSFDESGAVAVYEHVE